MEKHVGVIMNGVTGRMGTNQHLVRSVLAIRDQGGVTLSNGDRLIPDPVLVGRNEEKLQRLAAAHSVSSWTTNLDEALADRKNEIYFDSTLTQLRSGGVKKAIDAKKAVYCEKPTATTASEALELYHYAKKAGIKHGVVQDKLWLPGLLKMQYLINSGFFGRIVSARMEFGYWVFDGYHQPGNRPSWNYRKEDGGGLFVDMFPHWRYVVDNLFGPIKSVSSVGNITVPKRVDESGKEYDSTAEDTAHVTFEMDSGIFCHINCSWQIRARREEIMHFQIDGTEGSAICGLRDCWIQAESATPKPVWNPDIPNPVDFFEGWTLLPNRDPYDNAFKVQWEKFLRHYAEDTPFPWDLLEGAKGVQLAELGLQSWADRKWVDIPSLA